MNVNVYVVQFFNIPGMCMGTREIIWNEKLKNLLQIQISTGTTTHCRLY
jgi:hypothetical protein